MVLNLECLDLGSVPRNAEQTDIYFVLCEVNRQEKLNISDMIFLKVLRIYFGRDVKISRVV